MPSNIFTSRCSRALQIVFAWYPARCWIRMRWWGARYRPADAGGGTCYISRVRGIRQDVPGCFFGKHIDIKELS